MYASMLIMTHQLQGTPEEKVTQKEENPHRLLLVQNFNKTIFLLNTLCFNYIVQEI